MSDVISRQVVISAICSACGKIDCDKMNKCEKLQLPPANCSEFPNSSDTISRQAVKEILDKNQMPYHVYSCVWDAINALPSALSTNLAEVGADCISRQAAIEALNKLSESTYEVNYGVIDCDDAIGEIKQLPSAQPEIIYCKDCSKHNKRIGDYVENSDGTYCWSEKWAQRRADWMNYKEEEKHEQNKV